MEVTGVCETCFIILVSLDLLLQSHKTMKVLLKPFCVTQPPHWVLCVSQNADPVEWTSIWLQG